MPQETLLWQDPVPDVDHRLINSRDAVGLKRRILATGLSNSELVRAAWASASSFRASDMRGGANGARVRLAPQSDWECNDPRELSKVLGELEGVQQAFNRRQSGGKRVSLADVIVLAGAAAIERAAKDGGTEIEVPFNPGRTDATAAQTDVASFAALEPQADGFRNYLRDGQGRPPSSLLVEKADLLELTVPEMAVLIGGMRALGANTGGTSHGVLTDRPGTLSNDFFVNLLDMSTSWTKAEGSGSVFVGRDRKTGREKWSATEVDLVFGSNSELRAVAEVYAFEDSREKFVRDFAAAWTKVMNLDRFDR